MPLTIGKPIIFMACANSYSHGKRLRYLVQERKQLARIVDRNKPFQYYLPIQKGNRPLSFFLQKLSADGLHRQVKILHLSGHHSNGRLALESEDFESEVSFEELSEILFHLPQLKLVYLNGCASPELVDFLLKKDIPAIIATQTQEKDEVINLSARLFYQHLSKGKSIWESFQECVHQFENLRLLPVSYEVETDTITCPKEEEELLPWGMYYFEENQVYLTEKPPRRTSLPISMQSSKKSPIVSESTFNLPKFVLVALLALLAVGASLYLLNPVNFSLILSRILM